MLGAAGCFLDRAPLEAPGTQPDSGVRIDAGRADASSMHDAGRDAGARHDAGRDARVDVPPDAGHDSGPPDAGPPPVLPVVDGLLVHFDARDVFGDGSTPPPTPGVWEDLTDDNHATCTNVAYEPDGLGPGRPAIFTNGEAGSRCEFPIPNFDNDLTIVVVLRTSDVRSDSNWYNAPVIVGGDRAGLAQDAALYLSAGRPGFARGGFGLQFHSGTAVSDDAPHLIALVREGDGAITTRIDTGDAQTGTSDSGNIRDPDVWRLASHDDAFAGRFACRYAEVLIYDRALTDGEVILVRDHLRVKWGL